MLTQKPKGRQVRSVDSINRYRPYPFQPTIYRPAEKSPALKPNLPLRKFMAVGFASLAFTVMLFGGKNLLTRVVSVQAKQEAPVNFDAASQAVRGLIAANPGLQISVSAVDIKSGSRTDLGALAAFDGASTTKLITAVAVLNEVEAGKQSLDQPVGAYPAAYQLQQMVNQSNNDSWNLLAAQIGRDNLEEYAHSIGLGSYKTGANLLSAADEATLLQKLYSGKLLNHQHTVQLLGYMQHTNNEDMIPAALPTAQVYHKFGLLAGNLHDAAIVDYQGHQIALVIYTNGPDGNDYSQRVQLIQQLTRAVTGNLN